MKPPIERIFVFLLAFGTERKTRHRCMRPVIRNSSGNGIAGTAIGAIGESVPAPPVLRVSYILNTVGAGRHIGRNQRLRRYTALAGQNFKAAGRRDGFDIFYFMCVHASEWR